jgi:hypothetical protein
MKIIYTILLAGLSHSLFAQKECDFIPKDLYESFNYIECKWDNSHIKKFKNTSETKAVENELSWLNFQLYTWEA